MKQIKINNDYGILFLIMVLGSFFFLPTTYAAIDTSAWNVHKNLEHGFGVKVSRELERVFRPASNNIFVWRLGLGE